MIADEQSLERLEEEEREEEALDDEDLDDELVDELDDNLDVLDEDDDLEGEEDEESEAEEEEEGEGEDEEEDESDDAVAEDSDSTSLEELLARRTAARQGTDDPDEDVDLSALSSEASRRDSRSKSKVTPLRNREEFVCKRCFLLKPKVQLADSERMLCRDCA